MSTQPDPSAWTPVPVPPEGVPLGSRRPMSLRGLPLAVVLFAATLVTTTLAGYAARTSPLPVGVSAAAWSALTERPSRILEGLTFSLALLSILLAHEMGHYLACAYYRVDASPPYFLPAPGLVGTFGAFIRIRAPLTSRRILFDVGVAGPLGGFLMLLPYLVLGVATVRPADLVGTYPDFGTPLLMRAALALRFGHVPSPLCLTGSPILFACWVGCLVTALNLLPVGQLDGGHVLTAMIGARARRVAWLTFFGVIALLLVTGWPGWLVWAILLLVLGLRHPEVADPRPLDRGRMLLGLASFCVFAICFMPVPVRIW